VQGVAGRAERQNNSGDQDSGREDVDQKNRSSALD
jgi:hypothetical protein